MTIFIAGDSTAAIKIDEKRPEAGWGEMINLYLNDNILIKNFAKNGRSTKSFIDLGDFDEMVKEFNKGDYLIIQFGHNDGKVNDKSRYTTYKHYVENLSTFVDKAKQLGVIPIIFSSVSRRKFLDDNINTDPNAVELYPLYANKYAANNNILFIDCFKLTQELYTKLGFELSKRLFLQLEPNVHENYLQGVIDNTHFNENGAKVIASLIASELLRLNILDEFNIKKDAILSFEEIKDLIK